MIMVHSYVCMRQSKIVSVYLGSRHRNPFGAVMGKGWYFGWQVFEQDSRSIDTSSNKDRIGEALHGESSLESNGAYWNLIKFERPFNLIWSYSATGVKPIKVS